jgi:hypothetical protein
VDILGAGAAVALGLGVIWGVHGFWYGPWSESLGHPDIDWPNYGAHKVAAVQLMSWAGAIVTGLVAGITLNPFRALFRSIAASAFIVLVASLSWRGDDMIDLGPLTTAMAVASPVTALLLSSALRGGVRLLLQRMETAGEIVRPGRPTSQSGQPLQPGAFL